MRGQVAFLVADQSRCSQHRPAQKGNAGFRAVLLKMTGFKASAWAGRGVTVCIRRGKLHPGKMALPQEGRRSRSSGACTRQRGCEPGCTSTPHPPFPARGTFVPRQVPVGSGPEVPGHRLTPGTPTATGKGTGAAGAGCARPPSPGQSPRGALSSGHRETLADLIG